MFRKQAYPIKVPRVRIPHSPPETASTRQLFMSEKYSYKNRKYSLVPYDPLWVKEFEEYASQIRKIFPDAQIEHIGSTSVQGMIGKPCIDVLVIVDSLDIVQNQREHMEQVGFEYAGEFVMENSRLFRIMRENVLLANIHFFLKGHSHNAEMLNLRDYLRTHPDEVQAYSNFKKELYSKYGDDYASYRKYKDKYMEDLKKRAARFTFDFHPEIS